MKDILRALKECGKKAIEDRSTALKSADYFQVAKEEELILLLKIATDRCEVLQKNMAANGL